MKKIITAAILIAAAAGCTHEAPKTMERPIVDVKALLTVTEDGAGGYEFKYAAPFADSEGNFDFTQKGALGNEVSLSFTLTPNSVPDLKFRTDGRDAIWIVDKKNVGPDGSPEGPYRGEQFLDFRVSEDGRTLYLTDINNDETLYQYGLRFDLGDDIVMHDPEMKNGGGGHG